MRNAINSILTLIVVSLPLKNSFAEATRPTPEPGRVLWSPAETSPDATFLSIPDQGAGGLNLTPHQERQLEFMQRIDTLVDRLHLHIDNAGFSTKMPADQEFRIFKGKEPGRGAILFNPKFWFDRASHHSNDQFVKYVLLRAEAVYFFRSHFDPEQATWVFNEEEAGWRQPIEMLKATIAASANWDGMNTPLSERDQEVRQAVDTAARPGKAFEVLARRAMWAIEERAADNWVRLKLQDSWDYVSPMVDERVNARERALAADFGRTRAAMTPAERAQFQDMLRNPIRHGVHLVIMNDPSSDTALRK